MVMQVMDFTNSHLNCFTARILRKGPFCDTVVFLVDLKQIRLWHMILDPIAIRKRNQISQLRAYFRFCFSTKVSYVMELRAQQSDYESNAWKTSNHWYMVDHGTSVFSKVRPFVNPFMFQSIWGRYYSAKSLREFYKDPLLFDPDLVSKENFMKLRNTR